MNEFPVFLDHFRTNNAYCLFAPILEIFIDTNQSSQCFISRMSPQLSNCIPKKQKKNTKIKRTYSGSSCIDIRLLDL